MVLKRRTANGRLNNLETLETPRTTRAAKRLRVDEDHIETPETFIPTRAARRIRVDEDIADDYGLSQAIQASQSSNNYYGNAMSRHLADLRTEKSYLHRNINSYNGSPDEFESWKRNTMSILLYTTLSPEEQVQSIVAKFIGEATLLSAEDVFTPKDLFEKMGQFFHKSAERILKNDCKQRPGESVRTFAMRLKNCLSVCKLLNKDSLLHFFMNGIQAGLKQGIESLLPHSFDRALQYAENYENKMGKNSKNLNNIEPETTKNELAEELLSLKMQLKLKEQEMATIKESSLISVLREKLQSKEQDLANIQSSSPKKSPFLGKCFCCKLPGHPFFMCPTASFEDKERIKKNYAELVKKMREERAKELNAKGTATNPQ